MPSDVAAVQLRSAMYGKDDLSSLSLFAGGFINYGYWRNIELDGDITAEQRVVSQQELYRLVLGALAVSTSDRVLEVGCGLGVGCALTAEEFGPRQVRGIDLVPAQLERARRVNAAALAERPGQLGFRLGAAAAIPYPDTSFDALISVEAAQHFDDIAGFAREACRVLAPGGRLGVTTFFATSAQSAAPLSELLETVASGVDLATPLDVVLDALQQAGFTDVTARSIGEHVWPAMDRWIAQTEYRDSWGRNFRRAAQRNLLDYYLVSASIPDADREVGRPGPGRRP